MPVFYPIKKKSIRLTLKSNQINFNQVIKKYYLTKNCDYMTVVIKRFADKASIQKLLGTIPKISKFDSHKFCGILKLKKPPIDIQKQMRDEWQ